MAWFRREPAPLAPREGESRVPEGLWVKCENCRKIIWKKDLDARDSTFKDAGKIGLWSKSDAQSHFADLEVNGKS